MINMWICFPAGWLLNLSDKFTIIDKDDVMNVFDKEAKKERIRVQQLRIFGVLSIP